mmetsp:Transcript_12372/g.24871  ORF Transcript_12372/g.24871 Transcript_12372/m.24871 type:complete len:166 (+) Transcript_12372:214-711(+)
MQSNRWLRRLLHVHIPGSARRTSSQSRNGHDDAVKARDERLYGGMKSLDIVLEDGGKAPWKSWKWHVWQGIAATFPALGIYVTAQYIESTHESKQNANDEDSHASTAVPLDPEEKKKKEEEETARAEDSDHLLARLEDRMNALEAQLESLRMPKKQSEQEEKRLQ